MNNYLASDPEIEPLFEGSTPEKYCSYLINWS